MHGATTLAILATLAAAGLPAQQRPAKVRALAGRVLDGDGKPALGAMVFLRWRAHPELPGLAGHTLGDRGIEERQFGVDANGRFRIEPTNPGPFLLVAHRGETSSTQVFPVLPGDFQTLRLEPTFYFAGGCVDGAGDPVAGAAVELVPTSLMLSRCAGYKQPERRARAVTGKDGMFRLAFEHGYLRDPRWNVLMGVFAEKGPLAVAGIGIQRPTEGARALTVILVPDRVVSGVVTDVRTRRPIANARVFDPAILGRETTTGADGRFALVAPGGSLVVVADGRQPAQVGANLAAPMNIAMPAGVPFRARLPRNLAGARVLFSMQIADDKRPAEWLTTVGDDGVVQSDALGLGMTHLVFVEVDGRFVQFYEGQPAGGVSLGAVALPRGRLVAGQVRDADGVPVAGARVALSRPGNRSVPARIAYTDRGGRFRFDDVFGARQGLAAEAGTKGQVGVVLPSELPDEPTVLSLPRGLSVQGVVVGPDGKPVPRAWITLYRTAPGDVPYVPAPRGSMTSLTGFADEAGKFRFDGLPQGGSWTVVVGHLTRGVHHNATASAQPGATVKLQTAVSQW